MSYATVETSVGNLVRNITGFTTTNVNVGDYRVLGHGVTRAAILRRGPNTREVISFGSPSTVLNKWLVDIELYRRFQTEGLTLVSDLGTDMQSLLTELDKWPNLNASAGVIDAQVVAIGQPEEWMMGRSRWWRQVVTVQAEELVQVTLSE